MSFIIETRDNAESESSASSTVTIEFPEGGLRWRIPWRTQLRWAVAVVWAEGWSAAWAGWWWRMGGA